MAELTSSPALSLSILSSMSSIALSSTKSLSVFHFFRSGGKIGWWSRSVAVGLRGIRIGEEGR
jgi:hypothetical protein